MKTLLLVLGNGFSMDLLSHIKNSSSIDLVNLFSKGDTVVWPDGSKEQGFLSYKHCPALWSLGARPYMQSSLAAELVEDIITCANIFSCSSIEPPENNLYMNAYYELVVYLKHLFIQYNAQITDDDLLTAPILKWGWYDLIKRAYDSSEYKRILIITYNYDIFLERILQLQYLNFSVNSVGNGKSKIVILKPHGSISFAHEKKSDIALFTIRKSKEMYEAALSDFSIKYTELNENYLINALIPPAGDSSRLTFKWAKEIRDLVNQLVDEINVGDKVAICGLSYWHVDRGEIDDLLIRLSSKKVATYMVNPNPPRALNAVLTCVLPNHIMYTSSDLLGGVL